MSSFSHYRRLMMFTCRDANDFLVEYLEGALPPAIRSRFEKHLARCERCQAYLDQYRRTIELVKADAADEAEPPLDLVDVTLAFLREHYDDAPVNGTR